MTPDVLYEIVVEADERLALAKDECQLNYKVPKTPGVTGERVSSKKSRSSMNHTP